MEPPVATSGPTLRRAATFSHRTERALKDVNGRGGLVNKSQESLSVPKTKVDGQKVARPGKQYSAVASRYAAPLASKKPISNGADGPHSGNGNVTKLPFITGRSAPQHKRRPSTDNLAQPSMVFAASRRDSKPNTPQKKPEVPSNAVKRPRVVKRASFSEKNPQVLPRQPRFYSLDKGQNGMLRGSVDTSETNTASLLYSAAHWLSLIKLAAGEKKHEVVLDLFRLAIKLKAEPSDDVVGHLKRYQKLYPGDEVVTQLVQQCEGIQLEVSSTNSEVIDKSVCEPEESKTTASGSGHGLSNVAPVSETIAVVNEAAVTKDVPIKPPHLMGRMLSRSATFSVVDKSSQSQHAKAEYGKKLAKTVEFLAEQAAAIAAAKAGNVAETSPSETQDRPLDRAACNSEASSSFPDVGAKILALAAKLGSKAISQRGTDKASNPVLEAGSTLMSGQDNGSAEKPVDSLENWLNGDSSDKESPGVQSSPREGMTGLVEQSSPSKTQIASTASLPIVDTDIKSPTASTVGMIEEGSTKELLTPNVSFISEEQATPGFKVASINVDLSSELGSNCAAALASPSSMPAVSEVGSTREAAGCSGKDEKPVDSLSEWLDGDSSEIVTPEVQSALSEAPVDLSPDRSRAVKLMDVDSLMREVVSHIIPEEIANASVDSEATLKNGRSPAHELQSVGTNWPETGEQSMTEIVENISRSHRHSLSAEANLLSVPGSVEEKVKLFTVLAEVRGGSPDRADSPESSIASKERHEAEAAAATNDVTSTTTDAVISAEADSAALHPSRKTAGAVNDSGEPACATQTSVDTGSKNVHNESSKVVHATPPLRMLTKQRSMKGETVTPFIPSTPSAATPSEPASARILRSRHRRASSVGNMTPRGPFDMSGECSPFADSAGSPSGQSSSTKSKRTSRNSKEVTPRIDLPKPSWKSIVEREMKGSKLKDLLATKLPEETSPLAEYVQTQMENQGRDSENGSMGAKDTSSPSKRVTKLTKSSSKKKSALKDDDQEAAPEPKTAQKLKTLNESEQESVAEAVTPKATPCKTPGSAVRRSARLQNRF